MAGPQQAFAVGVLKGVGAPVTPQNLQAIVGWIHAESGTSYSGVNGSIRNNPLNTTQPAPGSYGTGSQGNIQSYPSLQTGLRATVQTLKNGYYGSILGALNRGNNPQAVASAIGSSPWGTSGSLASQAIAAAGAQTVPGGGGISGTGGIAPVPGGSVAKQLGMTPPRIVLNKAAIASNYLANEPRINPFVLPIPGTRQTTSADVPAAQNPLLQPGQPLALGQPLTRTVPGHLLQAHNALAKLAGTGLNVHPALRAGTVAGGFLPRGATYIKQRADQGRDGQTNPGGPILADGNGKVVAVLSDPNGFGPSYPVIAFTTGPYAGRTLYFGHTLSTVKQGQTVRAGQVISHTGTHGVGNATVPGWFEIGFAPGGIPGAFGQPTPF